MSYECFRHLQIAVISLGQSTASIACEEAKS